MILILDKVFSFYQYLFVHMLLLWEKFLTGKYFFSDCDRLPCSRHRADFPLWPVVSRWRGWWVYHEDIIWNQKYEEVKETEWVSFFSKFISIIRQIKILGSYIQSFSPVKHLMIYKVVLPSFQFYIFQAPVGSTNLEDTAYCGPLEIRRKSLPSNYCISLT